MRELVDFVARFDPAFPARVRGAAPEALAELEALAGRPLPRVLRAFLATLGEEAGDLRFVLGLPLRASEMLGFYRDLRAGHTDPGLAVQPHELVLVLDPDDWDLAALDLRTGPEDPAVVYGSGEERHLLAERLSGLLHLGAFEACRMRGAAHERVVWNPRGPRALLAELRAELADRFDVDWSPHCDRVLGFGTLPGAALVLREHEGAPPYLCAAGEDLEAIARITSHLEAARGFEPSPRKLYQR